MSTVNRVIIIGNITGAPEIRSFQNGGRIANFSVATNEQWKDKDSGEKKERVQFHRIVVSNENLVKLCENYLVKGSKIYLEGQLETRKYTDKDGVEKYTTEVAIRPYKGQITMLDSKGDTTHKTTPAEPVNDMDDFDAVPF